MSYLEKIGPRAWLRRNRDFTRFVLLGRSRTGSNLVRGMLSSRQDVRLYGEIFKNPDSIEWGFDHPCNDKRQLDLYRRDPVRFLLSEVWRAQPGGVRAVGFKLFYYHAQTSPRIKIWQMLRGLPELRVIHLTRRNILRTHLSRVLAARSDRWISTTAEPETAATVMLDETECLEAFIQTRAWEDEARETFRNQRILEVQYEELVSRQSEVMAEVQTFLGLEVQELRAQSYPQSRWPLHQVIVNYAELERRFRGTPWESFFEESSPQPEDTSL